jgi:hypothetical protein
MVDCKDEAVSGSVVDYSAESASRGGERVAFATKDPVTELPNFMMSVLDRAMIAENLACHREHGTRLGLCYGRVAKRAYIYVDQVCRAPGKLSNLVSRISTDGIAQLLSHEWIDCLPLYDSIDASEHGHRKGATPGAI